MSANEESLAANEAISPGIFTIAQNDGFTIKYGIYPHSVGMQIFDKAAAEAMANEMTSFLGKATRLWKGVPVYAGHPDHPDLTQRARFTDGRARGWITEIVVGENEAKFVVAYNSIGKTEVEDAQWAAYSPLWIMAPAANIKGHKAFRPVKLKSMALTNNPNMDVEPLVLANEEDIEEMKEETPAAGDTMITRIREALTKEGLIKPEDSDEMIMSVIGSLISSMAWERQRKQEMEKEDAKLQMLAKAAAYADNEAGTLGILEAAITRLSTLAANEEAAAGRDLVATRAREMLTDRLLDHAITMAAINPPQRDALRVQILTAANEADLTTALASLVKPKPAAGSTLLSKGMGGARAEVLAANDMAGRNQLREAAVQEALTEITKGKAAKPGDADRAWNLARSRKPELFTH
ncbi:hypothetical protein [Prosthecobacter algae]|uniref:hypothetical protein n=1 Tax=Prosthecobacter algae TaxID=1144682 RepID=UPI0031F182D5